MARWMVAALMVLALAVAGCGKKQLGPVDADSVKEADRSEVKNQMDESAKHLPPGVKMPAGAIPGSK